MTTQIDNWSNPIADPNCIILNMAKGASYVNMPYYFQLNVQYWVTCLIFNSNSPVFLAGDRPNILDTYLNLPLQAQIHLTKVIVVILPLDY